MDDLDLLARDFGYRPQGKYAPIRSDATGDRPVRVSTSSSSTPLFNDIFGGPPKFANPSYNNNDFDYDSIFKKNNNYSSNNKINNNNNGKTPSFPVYDKPVYDDDIFEGLPGMKSKSVSSSATNMRFEDNVFASMASSSPKQNRRINDQFDSLLGSFGRDEKGAKEVKNTRSSSLRGFGDLLGYLGRNEKVPEPKSSSRSSSSRGFDDLLDGFGSSSPASGSRTTPESRIPPKSTRAIDDPFVVLESTSTPASSSSGVFTDPPDKISNPGKSGSSKANASSVSRGDFDDLHPLNGFGKSVTRFSPENDGRDKDWNPLRMGPSINGTQTSSSRTHSDSSSFRYSGSPSRKEVPVDNFQESPLFDMPSGSANSKNAFSQNFSSPRYTSASFDKNFQADISLKSEQSKSDDIWLSVSEIPLFTQPTKAPPPSRPPPPIPWQTSKVDGDLLSAKYRKKDDEYSSSYSSYTESPRPGRPVGRNFPVSQVDEVDNFVTGRTQNRVEYANAHSNEDMDAAAAAMKEAMDRAEAKFRHAKEVRERENAKAARSKESMLMEKDEHVDTHEREFRENEVRLELERRQREKEEEEREQRRFERERMARQAEIERERARQAVERATREARERAAAEARLRAERANVEKAQAEARARAERAAVQRAQAEARERAAAAAAVARQRANEEARAKEAHEKAESRRRAERAAVEKAAERAATEAWERVATDARERAASEARERAAAEACERSAAAASRMNQQKNEPDLEDFFSMRPNSAPKAMASSSDPVFDSQFQTKGGPDPKRGSSATSVSSTNMMKASSTTNIVDDLSSIFGGPPSSGEFQEVEGETEERRRARLERHLRTQERAAKALAEKNQRDLQAQREQEERHRIAETLDFEIKRWAAGKEGNLRVLLSTLQYVLWPECGWQPVSLTDLITGASVKKFYRKATLCIHPDKVQQKGATLQQKYIAGKVFDLLKEAWDKFNSEELF